MPLLILPLSASKGPCSGRHRVETGDGGHEQSTGGNVEIYRGPTWWDGCQNWKVGKNGYQLHLELIMRLGTPYLVFNLFSFSPHSEKKTNLQLTQIQSSLQEKLKQLHESSSAPDTNSGSVELLPILLQMEIKFHQLHNTSPLSIHALSQGGGRADQAWKNPISWIQTHDERDGEL